MGKMIRISNSVLNMKFRIQLIGLAFLLCFSSCQEQLPPVCYEGTVLGRIRSGGGGPAVSVHSSAFGKHEWGGNQNVVEALNLGFDFPSGTKIYFQARLATEQERMFFVTADGNESAKPVIFVTAVSTEICP
jgi:hypothetical protein